MLATVGIESCWNRHRTRHQPNNRLRTNPEIRGPYRGRVPAASHPATPWAQQPRTERRRRHRQTLATPIREHLSDEPHPARALFPWRTAPAGSVHHFPIAIDKTEGSPFFTLEQAERDYHGGDPVYKLEGIPGLWLEQCAWCARSPCKLDETPFSNQWC